MEKIDMSREPTYENIQLNQESQKSSIEHIDEKSEENLYDNSEYLENEKNNGETGEQNLTLKSTGEKSQEETEENQMKIEKEEEDNKDIEKKYVPSKAQDKSSLNNEIKPTPIKNEKKENNCLTSFSLQEVLLKLNEVILSYLFIFINIISHIPKYLSSKEISQMLEKYNILEKDEIIGFNNCQEVKNMDANMKVAKQKINGTKDIKNFLEKKRNKDEETKDSSPTDKKRNFLSEDNVMKIVINCLFILLIESCNYYFRQTLGEIKYLSYIQMLYKYEKKERLFKDINYDIKSKLKISNINDLKNKTIREVVSMDINGKYSLIDKDYNKKMFDIILEENNNNYNLKKFEKLRFMDWIDFVTYKDDKRFEGEDWAQILNQQRIKKLIEEYRKKRNKNMDDKAKTKQLNKFIYLLFNFDFWFFIKHQRESKPKNLIKKTNSEKCINNNSNEIQNIINPDDEHSSSLFDLLTKNYLKENQQANIKNNQPYKHIMNQLNNKSMNQFNYQSMIQPNNQSMNQLNNQKMKQLNNQSMIQLNNQSMVQLNNQSMILLNNQSMNQLYNNSYFQENYMLYNSSDNQNINQSKNLPWQNYNEFLIASSRQNPEIIFHPRNGFPDGKGSSPF